MPEVRRDRPVGREAMKITLIGALAIAGVVVVIAADTAIESGTEQDHTE